MRAPFSITCHGVFCSPCSPGSGPPFSGLRTLSAGCSTTRRRCSTASVVTIGRTIRWRLAAVGGLVVGALVAYWIVGLVPVETSKDPLTLFLAGMVAISAMILPGISGSFILLILGQYAYVLASVKALDVVTLLPFAGGCVVGIMGFSRVLSWLFMHYERLTITVLVGFMLGSLRKIWPFKETITTRIDRHGDVVPVVERNLLPDPAVAETWYALGLAVLGLLLVVGLDHLQRRLYADRPAEGLGPTTA